MLDLSSVRAIAKEYGLKEVDLSKSDGVVAYVSPFRSFRLNIYYNSKTVVTQILHPKCGLCQLVRRGVTPSILKKLIKSPEASAGLAKYEGRVSKVPFGPSPKLVSLNGEKMWFVGLRSCRDELKSLWKPSKTLNFCIGPDSYLFFGIKGKSKYHCWWSNIPKSLKATLRNREYELPQPIYGSLGSGGRYFIKFENGAFEWVGSKNFSKLIKKFPAISKVSFGTDWDSFHILFNDGTQAWNNLPSQLEKILEKRKDDQPDVCEVSLAPDNPSFFHLTFSDGSWRSHGVPQIMEKQLYYGHNKVYFASKGQCLLTYNDDVTEDEEIYSDDEENEDFDEFYQDSDTDEEKQIDDEWVNTRN